MNLFINKGKMLWASSPPTTITTPTWVWDSATATIVTTGSKMGSVRGAKTTLPPHDVFLTSQHSGPQKPESDLWRRVDLWVA